MPPEAIIRQHATRFTRFGMVGVVNTAFDFAVFSTLIYVAHMSALAANGFAWLCAVSLSYVLNSHFTFDGARRSGSGWARFAMTNFAGLVVSSAVIALLAHLTGPLIAKIAATGLSLLVNYTLSALFVFRDKVVG